MHGTSYLPAPYSRVCHGRIAWLWAALLVALADGLALADGVTIQLALDGARWEGTPIAWNDSQALLLARNGFLLQFPVEQATDYQEVSPSFRPWSQSEMRGQLQREFGRQFEVSGTGRYLVVHPAGQKDRWAQRFDTLYRSFTHHFGARGMQPAEPQFPLVAAVLHSREQFLEHSRLSGSRISTGILGYYSPRTNRVILYDVTQGDATDDNWHINAETIIHEAAHQMAFNTGIHSRAAAPPRWAGEGLAMLFEAPGVWNPRHYPRLQDRIHRRQLEAFRQLIASRRSGALQSFVGNSDGIFASAPAGAYAQAWALSFFLSEQEPAKYLQYLARTAARQPLKEYGYSEQVAEFTAVFGSDWSMQEARFLRFIAQLP